MWDDPRANLTIGNVPAEQKIPSGRAGLAVISLNVQV